MAAIWGGVIPTISNARSQSPLPSGETPQTAVLQPQDWGVWAGLGGHRVSALIFSKFDF